MNRNRLHDTTAKSAHVRLFQGQYCTVLAIYKSPEANSMESRPVNSRYHATRNALLSDPEAPGAEAPPPPEYHSVPKQPRIYVQLRFHRFLNRSNNPFLIQYPSGDLGWLEATEIESQVALALVSDKEQSATACPPRDPYVHRPPHTCRRINDRSSHAYIFIAGCRQNCLVGAKRERTSMIRL